MSAAPAPILNRRIELLKPRAGARDAVGARATSYEIIRTTAALLSDAGRERGIQFMETPAGSRRYIVRWRQDLSTSWRLRADGQEYDIIDAADYAAGRRAAYLILSCRTSQTRGRVGNG